MPEARDDGPAAHAARYGGARVLVVEDNPVNSLLARRMLSRLGHTADTAPDGEQALQALERGTYDLVLMDCQMPVLDGFETTRRLRARWGDASGNMLGFPPMQAIRALKPEVQKVFQLKPLQHRDEHYAYFVGQLMKRLKLPLRPVRALARLPACLPACQCDCLTACLPV